MSFEKKTASFGDENFPDNISKNVLQKTLKIVQKPYKDRYTAGLNIQGEYLRGFGFKVGDTVDVVISENRIRIEKVIDDE